jgi:hypothetical protein
VRSHFYGKLVYSLQSGLNVVKHGILAILRNHIYSIICDACVKLKKIATILLLCLFLFNWFGYRFITTLLESRADDRMEAAIDREDYSNNSLISIKIPSNVPYYNATTSFERAEGEIEINGMHYKYVKRRIVKDSLELLCVADLQKTQIRKSGDNFFKLVNDLHQNNSNKKQDNSVAKSLLADYLVASSEGAIQPAIIALSSSFSPGVADALQHVCRIPQEQPPDQVVIA